MTTAIIFTGQGSQFVGMGRDLAAANPAAAAIYAQADMVFPGLSALCFNGPEETLNETSHTQPAVFVTELALWEVVKTRFSEQMKYVRCMAGHSLGEYSALAAAGALAFQDALRLVLTRGAAMASAGTEAPGGMMVVLGLDDATVEAVVGEAQTAGAQVWVANLNSPGQVVLAGTRDGLALAQQAAQAQGAKRCLPLAVSVACHTPLMQVSADALTRAMQTTEFHTPWVPIIANTEAQPVVESEQIRSALTRQLTSPVRWVESVLQMKAMGVDNYIEIGPKAVLAGLVQRIDRSLRVASVTDLASLDNLVWEAD